jgi:hypothetical protein
VGAKLTDDKIKKSATAVSRTRKILLGDSNFIIVCLQFIFITEQAPAFASFYIFLNGNFYLCFALYTGEKQMSSLNLYLFLLNIYTINKPKPYRIYVCL